jgi:hypothetical protein
METVEKRSDSRSLFIAATPAQVFAAMSDPVRGTHVHWRQTFDTLEEYERIAGFVAGANQQNLQRLATEVLRSGDAALPPTRQVRSMTL